MAKYLVNAAFTKCLGTDYWKIDADSPEKAIELVENGCGEYVDGICEGEEYFDYEAEEIVDDNQ